jgi:hypothetical protein
MISTRSDTDIKLNIEGESRCCPQVDQSGILIKVTDGIVTLSGHVRNFFHKYGAEDAVKRVAGVLAIANDIQVYSSQANAPPDPLLARSTKKQRWRRPSGGASKEPEITGGKGETRTREPPGILSSTTCQGAPVAIGTTKHNRFPQIPAR